ncbi:flagellar basal body-associated protein FliL [Sulfurimonas sp.]|nr:flagellar basal body-associated protein FliL [Sulfurimonas sp.]
MAEEENTEENQTEAKPKNTLMIVIIAVLVLIIIAGAVIAVLLMGGDDEAQMQQQNAPQMQEKSSSSSSSSRKRSTNMVSSRKLNDIGILYPLDTFTVNLKSDAGRRYLKATISLELNGEELSIELDNKSPVIRDRIIRILSSKTLEEISSKKGKQKVSEQIIDTMNSMIVDGSVKGIYFTEFVIQ